MNCACDCGAIKEVAVANVIRGRSKSCGCWSSDVLIKRNTTHGMVKAPEYSSWTGMKERCNNPNAVQFKDYGGRGIKICDRWNNSFENFFADMGKKPKGFSIERIDNNGNYCPENCKWDSRRNQSRNTSRTLRITFNGETHCLVDWAEIIGIQSRTLQQRITHRGWSIERALTTPLMS